MLNDDTPRSAVPSIGSCDIKSNSAELAGHDSVPTHSLPSARKRQLAVGATNDRKALSACAIVDCAIVQATRFVVRKALSMSLDRASPESLHRPLSTSRTNA